MSKRMGQGPSQKPPEDYQPAEFVLKVPGQA